MSIIDRIYQIIDFKQINVRQFERSLGLGNNTLGKAKARDRGISSDTISKIVEFYRDINLNWLISGEGEMLKSSKYEAPVNPMIANDHDHTYNKRCKQCERYLHDIERYCHDIERYQQEIATLNQRISSLTKDVKP